MTVLFLYDKCEDCGGFRHGTCSGIWCRLTYDWRGQDSDLKKQRDEIVGLENGSFDVLMGTKTEILVCAPRKTVFCVRSQSGVSKGQGVCYFRNSLVSVVKVNGERSSITKLQRLNPHCSEVPCKLALGKFYLHRKNYSSSIQFLNL